MVSDRRRVSWLVPLRRVAALALAGAALAVGACGTEDPVAAGSGTVSGEVDGRAFDAIASAYRIGQPDDPEQTIVVHLFGAAVGCSEIAEPGWDEVVADDTQVLEIKLIGMEPGDYPVATDGRPSAGQCDANYTVTSTSGTPSEVSATDGVVTLEAVTDDGGAKGSFELTLPGGSVSGTFDASSCADGREP